MANVKVTDDDGTVLYDGDAALVVYGLLEHTGVSNEGTPEATDDYNVHVGLCGQADEEVVVNLTLSVIAHVENAVRNAGEATEDGKRFSEQNTEMVEMPT